MIAFVYKKYLKTGRYSHQNQPRLAAPRTQMGLAAAPLEHQHCTKRLLLSTRFSCAACPEPVLANVRVAVYQMAPKSVDQIAPHSELRQALRVGLLSKTFFNWSAFPMFVPSLSWQNDHFYIKTDNKKCVFLTWHHVLISGFSSALGCSCEKRHSCLSFPCVCPEPVLVKRSFLYITGATSGVFRTGSISSASTTYLLRRGDQYISAINRSECRGK